MWMHLNKCRSPHTWCFASYNNPFVIPPPTYQYFKPLHFCCTQESTTFWIVAQGGVSQQKNRIVKKVDSRRGARLHRCRNKLQQKNQCISKSFQNRLPLVVRWRSYIYVVYAACPHHSAVFFFYYYLPSLMKSLHWMECAAVTRLPSPHLCSTLSSCGSAQSCEDIYSEINSCQFQSGAQS